MSLWQKRKLKYFFQLNLEKSGSIWFPYQKSYMRCIICCSSLVGSFFITFILPLFYFILRKKSEKKAGREEKMKIFVPIFGTKIFIFFANLFGQKPSPQATAKIGTKRFKIPLPVPPIKIKKKLIKKGFPRKKFVWKFLDFQSKKSFFWKSLPQNFFIFIGGNGVV